MSRASGADLAKVVASSGDCTAAAGGGSSEVTDLGPNDAVGVTTAQAAFTFPLDGTFKICYKLSGGSYMQVGTALLTVKGPPRSFATGSPIRQGVVSGTRQGVGNDVAMSLSA